MHFGARRFTSAVQGVVDGRLVFESQVTGMVMDVPASAARHDATRGRS